MSFILKQVFIAVGIVWFISNWWLNDTSNTNVPSVHATQTTIANAPCR